MQNFVSHSEKHHYRMEVDIIFSPHENQTENFVPEHRNDHISYFLMYEISKWNLFCFDKHETQENTD